MIRPALFVGLGTTGAKVLQYLRRLMFEEFQTGGLPIFRYVVIETDEQMEGHDPDLGLLDSARSYERIHMVHATISSTAPLKQHLNSAHPLYDASLQDWLNPAILDWGDRSFRVGAKNMRMAGRLCFWHNWPSLAESLNTHLDATRSPANLDSATRMLLEHYGRKDFPPPPDPVAGDVDIYVVGCLLGGTCSGALVDIGYYLRKISGGGAASVHGTFTMCDPQQAAQPNLKERAANVYGALWELNYYSDKRTEYRVDLPGEAPGFADRDAPYDYVMFASKSGTPANIQFTDEEGAAAEEELNEMVAMGLFLDTVADVGNVKRAIRTDWEQHPAYRALKPVPKGEPSRMVRFMAGTGLAAFWYPKYRIASAAACDVAGELLGRWLASNTNPAPEQDRAGREWDALLTASMTTATTSTDGRSLTSRLDQELDDARQQLRAIDASDELERAINVYPVAGQAYRQLFGPGGDYYQLMQLQQAPLRVSMNERVEELVRQQLNRLDVTDSASFADLGVFFGFLDKRVEDSIARCPATEPTVDIRMDYGPMKRAETNLLLSFAAKKDAAVLLHRDSLVDSYDQRVRQAFRDLRNWFIRPVLEELRASLGFGGPNARQAGTVYAQIEQIGSRVRAAQATFAEEYTRETRPRVQLNVRIVTNSAGGNIDQDARELSASIQPADVRSALVGERSMHDFLMGDKERIVTHTKEVFRREALHQIRELNVVTKAHEMATGSGAGDVQHTVSRAVPYLTLKPGFAPLPVATSSTLVVGRSADPNTLTDLRGRLSGLGYHFERLLTTSPVDHLVFFYKEEPAIALDDLAAYDVLRDRFERCSREPSGAGHLTHQDPSYFDIQYAMRVDLLTRWAVHWVDILRHLWKRDGASFRPNAFRGVLHRDDRDNLYYRYEAGGQLPQRVYLVTSEADAAAGRAGMRSLATSGAEQHYNRFIRVVQSAFREIGRDVVEDIVNEGILSSLSADQHDVERAKLQRFLDEVFTDDIVDLPAAAVAAADQPMPVWDEEETELIVKPEAEGSASAPQGTELVITPTPEADVGTPHAALAAAPPPSDPQPRPEPPSDIVPPELTGVPTTYEDLPESNAVFGGTSPRSDDEGHAPTAGPPVDLSDVPEDVYLPGAEDTSATTDVPPRRQADGATPPPGARSEPSTAETQAAPLHIGELDDLDEDVLEPEPPSDPDPDLDGVQAEQQTPTDEDPEPEASDDASAKPDVSRRPSFEERLRRAQKHDE